MKMSPACTAPTQPRDETEQDQQHERYPEYCRYRAAMAEQLVAAASWASWLQMRERAEDDLDERTRFWPDGTRVVYEDAADASEHRLRIMESGGFEAFEQEEPDHNEFGDFDLDEDEPEDYE
jgi:hypothetical protein